MQIKDISMKESIDRFLLSVIIMRYGTGTYDIIMLASYQPTQMACWPNVS